MKNTMMIGAMLMCMSAPAFAMDDMATAKSMTDHGMMMMDMNKDGMVSMKEHEMAGEKMFKDADADGDKMVSKDEMMAMKQKEMKDMDMKMDMKDDGGMMMKH